MPCMNYPNGSETLLSLLKYLNNEDIDLYFEVNAKEPEDWNWMRQGFFHGERTLITNKDELVSAIANELNGNGIICYTLKDSYFDKHCGRGQVYEDVKTGFVWMFSSPHNNRYYKITETTYLPGFTPKNVPFSLECYLNGPTESCISIGTWSRDEEGYEFHSVGSRMFDYVDDEDLEVIWKGIKDANKYLNERFKSEED